VRLKRKIGSGGFGSVYLGVYRDRTVAVKRLHRSVKNTLATLESFRAECNVVNLKHPNIVRVLAATAGGLPRQLLCSDAAPTRGAGHWSFITFYIFLTKRDFLRCLNDIPCRSLAPVLKIQ